MNVQDLPRIPVLLYHRLDREKDPYFRPYCVDPENFAQQMSFLKKEGYKTISLEEMQRHYQFGDQVPERSIVITFDDGYYCNYTQAYPILQKFGFVTTIFLTTDLIRSSVSAVESKDSFLSWVEIKEMHQSGISFQAHGCSHRPLNTLTLDEVEQEARTSKKCIEKELNSEVKYFCYPLSQYNERIKRIIKQVGYVGACGGPPFWRGGPQNWFEIGRTEILGGDSFAQFRFKVQNGLGYYYFIKRQLGIIKKVMLPSRAPVLKDE